MEYTITERMTTAGVVALMMSGGEETPADYQVSLIFLAMILASPLSQLYDQPATELLKHASSIVKLLPCPIK